MWTSIELIVASSIQIKKKSIVFCNGKIIWGLDLSVIDEIEKVMRSRLRSKYVVTILGISNNSEVQGSQMRGTRRRREIRKPSVSDLVKRIYL